jgi:hypothetical protein
MQTLFALAEWVVAIAGNLRSIDRRNGDHLREVKRGLMTVGKTTAACVIDAVVNVEKQ